MANKDQLSLRQFLSKLRSRFADKRNKVEIIATLCSRLFDPKREFIGQHFDNLMLEMAYLSLSEEEKLHIVLKTLPSDIKGYAFSRNVQSVDELKEFCQQIYPPSVKVTPKKEKHDDKPRRVMEMECEVESEYENETESLDLEEDDDSSYTQLCHLVSKHLEMEPAKKKFSKPFEQRSTFNPSAEFKRESKFPSRKEFKPEPKRETNPHPAKSEVMVDLTKIEGTSASICFNCRQYGHNHESCTRPRTQIFCYKCGWPGVLFSECPSAICVELKEQKN